MVLLKLMQILCVQMLEAQIAVTWLQKVAQKAVLLLAQQMQIVTMSLQANVVIQILIHAE
jgi:hypothetical protein